MRSRTVGTLIAALVILASLVSVPAAADDHIDASESNEELPTEFDRTLLTDKWAPIPGYETQLYEQADTRWRECLNEIDYARDGAGLLGIGGQIYVDDRDGTCHTPQLSLDPELAFETYYDISNLSPSHVMKELITGFDFMQVNVNDPNNLTDDEKEKLEEARVQLAGDAASEAVTRNGGSDMSAWAAEQAAETAADLGVSTEQMAAVTNPQGTIDEIVNRIKEDSGKAITQGLGYVAQGLAFSGADRTFRETYAAAAGAGFILLAVMATVAAARLHRSGHGVTEVVERWSALLVGGVLGLAFTPVWLYVCTSVSDALSVGVVTWLGTSSSSITGSLIDPFNALTTETSPLGWLGVILLCILYFIAGLSLILVFVGQYLFAYFGSVGLGVMWGMVHSESGRQRLLRAVSMVAGVIFARPALLFMIGVAMKVTGEHSPTADGWSSDPMGTLFNLLTGLGALFMVVFAPAALTRFLPVVGQGGGVGRLAGAAAAGGIVGSRMAGMLPGRMHALASRLGGGARRGAQGSGAQGDDSGGGSGGGAQPAAAKGKGGAAAGAHAAGSAGRGAAARGRAASKTAARAGWPSGSPGKGSAGSVGVAGRTGAGAAGGGAQKASAARTAGSDSGSQPQSAVKELGRPPKVDRPWAAGRGSALSGVGSRLRGADLGGFGRAAAQVGKSAGQVGRSAAQLGRAAAPVAKDGLSAARTVAGGALHVGAVAVGVSQRALENSATIAQRLGAEDTTDAR